MADIRQFGRPGGQVKFHPDNLRPAEEDGKHCWHPQTPDAQETRVVCCHCNMPSRMIFEPQSWHGRFAPQNCTGPFIAVEGHSKDEPCPGPPVEKSLLV